MQLTDPPPDPVFVPNLTIPKRCSAAGKGEDPNSDDDDDDPEFVTYVPEDGEALVKSKRIIISRHGDKQLYAAVDIYFVETNWTLKSSRRNSLRTTCSYRFRDSHSPVTLLDGKTTGNSLIDVNLGRLFENLSITVDGQPKTLLTNSKSSMSLALGVPPKSSVFLYQSIYQFRTEVTFLLGTPSKLGNVGARNGYGIFKEWVFNVPSEEYRVADERMDAASPYAGTMTVESMPSIYQKSMKTTEWDDLPKAIRVELRRIC